ncbi:YndM family protein [Allobacillus halotolerans]|uniref:YndM family protein n=1 Tax=Allobacillus halotolerans TaxID=570278 RepID=A0ABS6GLD6_9BACI|nr:YndM family protein [Allobacillus halotolerans]MBU6079445.1 YndM family protein [Allobacillus halotolerans]
MNHFSLILSKFVAMLVLLYIILGIIFGVNFMSVFWVTLTFSIVSYLIGDLLILPRTNNMVASVVDFVMSFAVIYFLVDAYAFEGNLFTASLLSAIGVTLFEVFFHNSVQTQMEEENNVDRRRYNLQTEVSEEIDPLIEDENRTD